MCVWEEEERKRWPGCLLMCVHGVRLHVLCGTHQPCMHEKPQQDEKCLLRTCRQQKVSPNTHIRAENLVLS